MGLREVCEGMRHKSEKSGLRLSHVKNPIDSLLDFRGLFECLPQDLQIPHHRSRLPSTPQCPLPYDRCVKIGAFPTIDGTKRKGTQTRSELAACQQPFFGAPIEISVR